MDALYSTDSRYFRILRTRIVFRSCCQHKTDMLRIQLENWLFTTEAGFLSPDHDVVLGCADGIHH
jgi:hypothetical protein